MLYVQVGLMLGDAVGDYDVDGIVEDLECWYGERFNIDDVDADWFTEIAAEHVK